MSKVESFYNNPLWKRLSLTEREFITKISIEYKMTFQEIKQLIDIAVDLNAWCEKPLSSIWTESEDKSREYKESNLLYIKKYWQELKEKPTSYRDFKPLSDFKQKPLFIGNSPERTLLGDCPVKSEKTRCCNLKTLDAVINCGFDCSYCTIQSFYKDGRILFEENLDKKLGELKLDPEKRYHIGTGQSSDSLMWGNKWDTLEKLLDFAEKNPNIVLELKSKSDNISYLLNRDVPSNVIVTWTLNTETIIKNEEHLTSTLKERLDAASKISERGVLIGFHFHPMVYYEKWKEDYASIVDLIMESFSPEDVALISIGTLTFIKPVIKKIRRREFKTKILQMPLVDAEGKHSYPYEIKREMFSHLYGAFKPWHDRVYFYMCMEDKNLWKDVFNREYNSNDEFEKDMLDNYFNKIDKRKIWKKRD